MNFSVRFGSQPFVSKSVQLFALNIFSVVILIFLDSGTKTQYFCRDSLILCPIRPCPPFGFAFVTVNPRNPLHVALITPAKPFFVFAFIPLKIDLHDAQPLAAFFDTDPRKPPLLSSP